MKVASQPMNIRKARRGDEPALARLLDILGYPASPDAVRERLVRCETMDTADVIVVIADDQVAGFAHVEMMFPLNHDTPVCHVSALAVAPEVRRRGVGRRLLEEIERLAYEGGCRQIVVTSAEHRPDAHSFYASNGWAYTGRRFGKNLDDTEPSR